MEIVIAAAILMFLTTLAYKAKQKLAVKRDDPLPVTVFPEKGGDKAAFDNYLVFYDRIKALRPGIDLMLTVKGEQPMYLVYIQADDELKMIYVRQGDTGLRQDGSVNAYNRIYFNGKDPAFYCHVCARPLADGGKIATLAAPEKGLLYSAP